MALNGPKQHKTSSKGQSPPQELEVGPHCGPYLLVSCNISLIRNKDKQRTKDVNTKVYENLDSNSGCCVRRMDVERIVQGAGCMQSSPC